MTTIAQTEVLATSGSGAINPIDDGSYYAYLRVPQSSNPLNGGETWRLYALPEITESKDATYSDAPILGRATPVKTYSYSTYRKLSVTFHLHGTSHKMHVYNTKFVHAVASAVHPVYANTYLPPRICQFFCGPLIDLVSVVVTHYSFSMSPEVVWPGLVPIDMTLQADMDVVYAFANLPGADDVLQGNY